MDARTRTWESAALIAGATALAYANSLLDPFVFLDGSAIQANPTIRHLWPIWRVLRPPLDRGVTVEGRPLLNLSLAINYALSGGATWSYHALNLLIHIAAALTLFGILRRTLRRDGMALAMALIWALHPLDTEAVTYVTQRAESLMGLFYLLTLYAFIAGAQRPERAWTSAQGGAVRGASAGSAAAAVRAPWLALSVLSCLCGMATKEVMVSAPIVVLLYDRAFVAGAFLEALRRRCAYYACLFATWLVLAALIASTGGNRGGTTGLGLGVSWATYVWTQLPAVAHYLRLALWPHPLVFYYAVAWLRPPQGLPSAVLVVGLAAASLFALWRHPKWGVLGFAFFAILAPTSLVPGISQVLAEHRMYLALVPVVVALILLADAGLRRLAAPRAVAASLVVLVAAAECAATAARNRAYRSELALWEDTIRKAPGNPYTQNNLGLALAAAGRPADAIVHLREAVRLDPRYAEGLDNLGFALAGNGQLKEAITCYRKAIALKPKFPEAYTNLGVALADSGQFPAAIAAFEHALSLDPSYAPAHNDLAVAYGATGRQAEAIAQYTEVLNLGADTAETQYNLANALLETGQATAAIAHYRRALDLRSNYPEAQANLGVALANAGRLDEAVDQYRRALALTPNDPDLHYDLALALRSLGRSSEAEAEFAIASRLRAGGPAP